MWGAEGAVGLFLRFAGWRMTKRRGFGRGDEVRGRLGRAGRGGGKGGRSWGGAVGLFREIGARAPGHLRACWERMGLESLLGDLGIGLSWRAGEIGFVFDVSNLGTAGNTSEHLGTSRN